MCEKEIGHEMIRFYRLWEIRVVPEGVGKGVEDNKAGIDTGAETGAMQIRGAAQQRVPLTGDEQCGWQTVQVGVDRRKHGIFGIG